MVYNLTGSWINLEGNDALQLEWDSDINQSIELKVDGVSKGFTASGVGHQVFRLFNVGVRRQVTVCVI